MHLHKLLLEKHGVIMKGITSPSIYYLKVAGVGLKTREVSTLSESDSKCTSEFFSHRIRLSNFNYSSQGSRFQISDCFSKEKTGLVGFLRRT